MQDFEKLGAFYLGRVVDADTVRPTDALLLYDARDLTTHAVIVGMTGSGKTGLGVALLEEAALDGVPALVIDPKGDLGNLALTFPALRSEDFRPFVDAEDAARRGESADAAAARTATAWREGLAAWGQDGARIARLRAAATVTVYTPGSAIGTPLALLRAFAAPPPPVRADAEALHDRIGAAVSGLLGLLGLDADPLQSREHILLATILEDAWRAGRDLDLGGLVRAVQAPPVERVGVMDLEAFFPAKERFALAMQLNGLLASPGFAAWLTGTPPDVGRLLFGDDGRPRIAVVSIAHLSDAERMFVVTLLLGELIAWMRAQPGTSTLRALLYMDEVFGYLPPTANPPSKAPLLTLLKQARAFGLGVVLATQNPVDLDYKALTNAGTWMIGRLQAERDKARLLDGLEGASVAAGKAVDRAWLDRALSALGPRIFLLHDVHEDAPVLFQTRWTLAWLRGPLSRAHLALLRDAARHDVGPLDAGAPAPASPGAPAPPGAAAPPSAAGPSTRPVLPPGVDECVLALPAGWSAADVHVYRPALLAHARLHYVRAKAGVDVWEDVTLLAPAPDDVAAAPWEAARAVAVATGDAVAGASFAPLPAAAGRAAAHAAWRKALAAHLQAARPLVLHTALGATQQPGESEGAFRGRLAALAREARDATVATLRARWTPKLETLRRRLRQAEDRAQREQAQVGEQTLATAVSVGSTLLGALFGRKLGSARTVGHAAGAVRAASRVARERADAARAQENVATVEAQLAEAQAAFEAEVAALHAAPDPAALPLEELRIPPRKADLDVTRLAVAWVPHRRRADGGEEAAV